MNTEGGGPILKLLKEEEISGTKIFAQIEFSVHNDAC